MLDLGSYKRSLRLIIKHKTADRRGRLSSSFLKEVDKGIDFRGVNFQIGGDSLTRILNKAAALSLSPSDTVWRATDNSMVQFTSEEFIGFALLAEQRYEYLLKEYWSQLE